MKKYTPTYWTTWKQKRSMDTLGPTGQRKSRGQTESYKDNLESRSASASDTNNVTEQKPVLFSTAVHMPGLRVRESKKQDLAEAGGTDVRLLPSFNEVSQQIHANISELQ